MVPAVDLGVIVVVFRRLLVVWWCKFYCCGGGFGLRCEGFRFALRDLAIVWLLFGGLMVLFRIAMHVLVCGWVGGGFQILVVFCLVLCNCVAMRVGGLVIL